MSKLLREDLEYIIHCDEQGNIIGPISKTHAHLKGVRESLCHYSTWSMVYNPITKKYGIQLKNQKKHDSSTGGKWDMGVAGHNCYIQENNEYKFLDFEENLQKEAEEEIGIKLKMYMNFSDFKESYKSLNKGSIGFIFDKFLYDTGFNKEWVGLGFIATCEAKLNFTDNEVVDFKWFSSNELLEFINSGQNICDPLELVYEKAESFRNKKLNC